MALLVDTTEVPVTRRREAVLDAFCSTAAAVDVTLPRHGARVHYRAEGWSFGTAYLHLAGGSEHGLARTDRLIRRAPDEIVSFTFLLKGRAAHTQRDVVHRDQPAEVSILESTSPWDSWYFDDDASAGSLTLSLADLGVPMEMVRRAAVLPASSPVHDLFASHLTHLAALAPELTDPWQAAALGAASVELARAFVASTSANAPTSRQTLHETLLTRVRIYIDHHLPDPSLSPAGIALAHNISVRQLYKIWPADGPSLAQVIIQRRLDGARHDLAAPSGRQVTVGQIARRWGFVDHTHFSRRFRAAFGVTPREWQRQHQAAPLVPGDGSPPSPRPTW